MGMTLEEAIKHCEEVAENQEECASKIDKLDCDSKSIRKCAEEHRQLAEWLRELKAYKDARVGCEYCKDRYREQYERPCSLCKHNFKDLFEGNDERKIYEQVGDAMFFLPEYAYSPRTIHDDIEESTDSISDWITDWLSTFNTDSATECFTAIQELKKKLEGDDDRN